MFSCFVILCATFLLDAQNVKTTHIGTLVSKSGCILVSNSLINYQLGNSSLQ
jgi:hypothetical protein